MKKGNLVASKCVSAVTYTKARIFKTISSDNSELTDRQLNNSFRFKTIGSRSIGHGKGLQFYMGHSTQAHAKHPTSHIVTVQQARTAPAASQAP